MHIHTSNFGRCAIHAPMVCAFHENVDPYGLCVTVCFVRNRALLGRFLKRPYGLDGCFIHRRDSPCGCPFAEHRVSRTPPPTVWALPFILCKIEPCSGARYTPLRVCSNFIFFRVGTDVPSVREISSDFGGRTQFAPTMFAKKAPDSVCNLQNPVLYF